jgi:uncharacterized protein YodC (DUF2158 family)
MQVPATTSATHQKTAAPKRAKSLFKIGDNVRLNSGSGLMCVTDIHSDGSIRCVWYGKNDQIQRATFPEAALEFLPDQIWDDELRADVTVPRHAAREKAFERARR